MTEELEKRNIERLDVSDNQISILFKDHISAVQAVQELALVVNSGKIIFQSAYNKEKPDDLKTRTITFPLDAIHSMSRLKVFLSRDIDAKTIDSIFPESLFAASAARGS